MYPELPERFRYFVTRCCEKKPENRFADARTAMEAFHRAFAEPDFHELESELEKLVEAWFARPAGDDLDVTKEIDQLLREHPDEEAMYTRKVPGLPADLVLQYVTKIPDALRRC